MRQIYFLLIILTLTACKDEVIITDDYTTNEEVENFKKINDDALYLQQIDKRNILYSLIRLDKGTNAYVLDLSDRDASILEIEAKDIENAKEIVTKLNQNR